MNRFTKKIKSIIKTKLSTRNMKPINIDDITDGHRPRSRLVVLVIEIQIEFNTEAVRKKIGVWVLFNSSTQRHSRE